MKPVKLADIENDIVRPGIEKMLLPLAMYRGSVSLGNVQRKWNFAIAMMHAEAENYGDGVKLSNNGDYPHLCEPVTKVQHLTMRSFFSRLRLNPRVTDNIPHLTEYVKWVCPEGFGLTPVSLYTSRTDAASWRIFRKSPKGPRVSPKEIFYPYVIHKPNHDDGGAYDMMVLVNNAVPKGLPDFLRADICQDLIVGLLSGEISKDELKGKVKGYTRKVFEMHPMKYGHLSLDAPLYSDSDRTLADIISSDHEAIV